jgi:hypothetical protein
MPTEWINHVKKYQAEHGCSYKDAMSGAKCSYNKGETMEGGKFNLKKTVNKGTKVVKKGARALEKNKNLIKLVAGDEYADDIEKFSKQVKKASQVADVIETQTGGGVSHLGRKVKHTVGKVRKTTKQVTRNIDKYSPLLEMVAPELAPEIIAINQGVKRVNGAGLGSRLKGKFNPYLKGGSYSVPHGGSFAVPVRGGCVSCNKPTNSSLISPHHPAFHPKPMKSYSELIRNN